MSALREMPPVNAVPAVTAGQQLDAKLDSIDTTLSEHSTTLSEHSTMLRQHGILLRAIARVILPAETLAELEREMAE